MSFCYITQIFNDHTYYLVYGFCNKYNPCIKCNDCKCQCSTNTPTPTNLLNANIKCTKCIANDCERVPECTYPDGSLAKEPCENNNIYNGTKMQTQIAHAYFTNDITELDDNTISVWYINDDKTINYEMQSLAQQPTNGIMDKGNIILIDSLITNHNYIKLRVFDDGYIGYERADNKIFYLMFSPLYNITTTRVKPSTPFNFIDVGGVIEQTIFKIKNPMNNQSKLNVTDMGELIINHHSAKFTFNPDQTIQYYHQYMIVNLIDLNALALYVPSSNDNIIPTKWSLRRVGIVTIDNKINVTYRLHTMIHNAIHYIYGKRLSRTNYTSFIVKRLKNNGFYFKDVNSNKYFAYDQCKNKYIYQNDPYTWYLPQLTENETEYEGTIHNENGYIEIDHERAKKIMSVILSPTNNGTKWVYNTINSTTQLAANITVQITTEIDPQIVTITGNLQLDSTKYNKHNKHNKSNKIYCTTDNVVVKLKKS